MQKKTRLQEKYDKVIVASLMKDFGLKNVNAVPRFKKVTINVGLKLGVKEPKYIDAAERTLTRITGQKPVKTLAKKSIANFKIREGNVVGMMVTMRGRRMYDFLDRFINLTLPRVRDFRGLAETSVDAHGNMSVGFREFIAFPEISPEDSELTHGLEVTIVTDAGNREKGLALLKATGFPFREAQSRK